MGLKIFGNFFDRRAKKTKYVKCDGKANPSSDNKLSNGNILSKTTTYSFQNVIIFKKPQYMENSQKSEKEYTKLEILK